MEIKKIEQANNINELLNIISFEDIKNAVLSYYQFDIMTYKKYFNESLKWIFSVKMKL